MDKPIYDTAISRELWSLWLHHGNEIYTRDGKNEKFPHGGHDVVNNLRLKETLDELARIYLPMCVYKFGLLNEQVNLADRVAQDDESDLDKTFERLDEIKKLIEVFDASLVATNANSLRKLLSEDSGLGDEARREAIDSPEAKRSLALALLSPLIRYAVVAACDYTHYDAQFAKHPQLVEALKGFVPRNDGARAV